MSILELFCGVDDFCQLMSRYEVPLQLGPPKRGPQPSLALSELMTIIIHFHQSHYRDFKAYYTQHVLQHLRAEFPGLVSYNRFVELMPTTVLPLCLYLVSRFATPLPVCHNKRIPRHKVFADLAERGKSSLGWFYGFKLHLIVDDQGELLAVGLTPGNVEDRKPVPRLAKKLWGKLCGDRGYLSQRLFNQLFQQGLQLITPIRKDMPNQLMPLMDKLLTRKRSLIETINDQLKNVSQIAHTRHRSATNFLVNLLAGLIAYTHQPKKPSLKLSRSEFALLPLLK
ncbi:MAG: IS982 family transposase [Anaerolineae bacterium]|nr:IS982 family transposase [Anaerolineae bacterium]